MFFSIQKNIWKFLPIYLDVVIFVNNDSISVVVRAEKLQESDIAQIQSIVQRELGAKVENIHISNK